MAADRWMQEKAQELAKHYIEQRRGGIATKLSMQRLLLRAMEEQRENDCKAVCLFCAHTTAKAWKNDKGEWVHYDNGLTLCEAAAIRRGGE